MQKTKVQNAPSTKDTARELAKRFKLEKMLTDISSKAISSFGLREFEQECLSIMGNTLGVHRVYIFEHRYQTDTMDNTVEWVASGIEPQKEMLQGIAASNFPWWTHQMKANKSIRFENIEKIPSEPEKILLRRQKIKSVLVVPLFVSKKYYGFIGFDECRSHRRWSNNDVNILMATTQIMTGFIERIQSEQALFSERQQMRSILDSIDQFVHIVDPSSYHIIYTNRACQTKFQNALVGEKCYRAFHGLDAPCTFCNTQNVTVQQADVPQWEHYNPLIDRHLLSSSRAIKWSDDGRNVGLTISVDISDRKKAEQALEESEQKYRQLFEMESDSIFLIDNETGNILEANTACESLYGYSRDQLLRMKNTDLSAEPKETHMATVSALTEAPIRYHRKKDGTVFPVEITARHFVWKNKDVHVAAIRDITQRIEADRTKDSLETQLRQAQKMESLGTLAGGIAHDFNNILSAIIGYTELAMFDKTNSNPSQTHLEQVLKASQRAKNLVSQILAFSRQAKSEFAPVQVGVIVKETVKMLKATLPASILIDTDIKTNGVVLGDANQLHQVVMNLCTNAYQAMKASEGCLGIELTEENLDHSISRNKDLLPGPYLKLSVYDTGVGMDKETIQRIFEPYFTSKESGEGTGLGLSVVYGIVEAHKGTMVVQSEIGKGSSFSVYLPRIKKSQAGRQPDHSDAVVAQGHQKVLYIDDEPDLANMIEFMLRRTGYRVTTRTSALEALELFKKNPGRFDLVITDLNMPNLSGDRLAKRMIEIRPDLPIILCTGFSDRLTQQDLTAAGIRAVALKPLLRADLVKVIQDALRGG